MALNIDNGAKIGFSANKTKQEAAAGAAELKDRMVICSSKELYINGERIGLSDTEFEQLRTAASTSMVAEKLTRRIVHIDNDISSSGAVQPESGSSPSSVTGLVTTVYAATAFGKMPLYLNNGKYYHELPGKGPLPHDSECLFEMGGFLYIDEGEGLKALFGDASDAGVEYGLLSHEMVIRINRNTTYIEGIQNDIGRHEDNITSLQGASMSHGSDIETLKRKASSAETGIGQLDSDLSALETRVAALENLLKMA